MAKRCSGIDHHGFSYLQFLVAMHHFAHQHIPPPIKAIKQSTIYNVVPNTL